jgi:hypothetical protein
MYDLAADPDELTNIIDKAPETELRALIGSLLSWMGEVDDPLLNASVTGPLHHATLQQLSSAS